MRHKLVYAALGASSTALLLAWGCGAIGTQHSADIILSPEAGSTIPFTSVPAGKSQHKKVEIRHEGDIPLNLKRIFIEGYEHCDRIARLENHEGDPELDESCEWIVAERPELPRELDDGQFLQMTIQYRPTSAEIPPDATLWIYSDVRDQEELSLTLTVVAAEPKIRVVPEVMSFPNVPLGDKESTTLYVYNQGGGTLEVDLVITTLTEPYEDPQTGLPEDEFSVEAETMLPWSILGDTNELATVWYEPLDDQADEAQIEITSNDDETPSVIVRLTSKAVRSVLEVQPNPVEFGELSSGSSSENLSISNRGHRVINVLDIRIEQEGGDYTIPSSEQNSYTLHPGDSQSLAVHYHPQTADGTDATLLIESDADNAEPNPDDPQHRAFRVPLVRTVDVLPAMLGISPPTVDMSDVGFGESRAEVITIVSTGGQTAEITAIRLSTPADNEADPSIFPSDAEFTITEGGEPVSLDPGDDHEVEVTFSRGPEDRMPRIATLLVESNARARTRMVMFNAAPPPGEK